MSRGHPVGLRIASKNLNAPLAAAGHYCYYSQLKQDLAIAKNVELLGAQLLAPALPNSRLSGKAHLLAPVVAHQGSLPASLALKAKQLFDSQYASSRQRVLRAGVCYARQLRQRFDRACAEGGHSASGRGTKEPGPMSPPLVGPGYALPSSFFFKGQGRRALPQKAGAGPARPPRAAWLCGAHCALSCLAKNGGAPSAPQLLFMQGPLSGPRGGTRSAPPGGSGGPERGQTRGKKGIKLAYQQALLPRLGAKRAKGGGALLLGFVAQLSPVGNTLHRLRGNAHPEPIAFLKKAMPAGMSSGARSSRMPPHDQATRGELRLKSIAACRVAYAQWPSADLASPGLAKAPKKLAKQVEALRAESQRLMPLQLLLHRNFLGSVGLHVATALRGRLRKVRCKHSLALFARASGGSLGASCTGPRTELVRQKHPLLFEFAYAKKAFARLSTKKAGYFAHQPPGPGLVWVRKRCSARL